MDNKIEVIKNTLHQCFPDIPFFVGLTEDTTDIEVAWKNGPAVYDVSDCLNDKDWQIQYSRLLGINQIKSVLRDTALEEDIDTDYLTPYPCRLKANINQIEEDNGLIDGFSYRIKENSELSETLEANLHNCIRDNMEDCEASEYDEDVVINRPDAVVKARHVLRKHFPCDRFQVLDTLNDNNRVEIAWVFGPTYFEVDMIMRESRIVCKLSRLCNDASLQAIELLIKDIKFIKDVKVPVLYQGSESVDVWVNIGPGTEDGEMLDIGYKPDIAINKDVKGDDRKKIILMITQAVFSMRSR